MKVGFFDGQEVRKLSCAILTTITFLLFSNPGLMSGNEFVYSCVVGRIWTLKQVVEFVLRWLFKSMS